MSFWFVLFMLIVVGIPVVMGTVQSMQKEKLKHARREMELQAEQRRALAGPQEQQVRQLEERVRVLERIVTDRGHDLAAEIERLRVGPPVEADRDGG